MFVQRSPFLCYWNIVIMFCCVHGLFDIVSLRLVKLIEYSLLCLVNVVNSVFFLACNVLAASWYCYSVIRLVGVVESIMSSITYCLRIHVVLFDRYFLTTSFMSTSLLLLVLNSVLFLTSLSCPSSELAIVTVSRIVTYPECVLSVSCGIYINSVL